MKAQRAKYKDFVESELKTIFQSIGQRSQWIKNGKKLGKNKEKTNFMQRNSSSAKSEESSS